MPASAGGAAQTGWKPSPLTRGLLIAFAAAAIAFGLGATAYWWKQLADRDAAGHLADNLPALALGFGLVAALTIFNLALRWARWHFLVRRAGARFAAKDSALIYLSSAAPAVLTPFYAGELLRVVMLGKRYARHRFDVVAIWLLERSSDLLAVCLFLSVVRANPLYVGIAAAVWLGVYGVLRAIYRNVRNSPFPQPAALLAAVLSSMLASFLPALGLFAMGAVAGFDLSLGASVDVFAGSTVFGVLTGAPSGLGVGSSAMVVGLGNHGVALLDAVAGTWFFRMGTIWLVIALGLGVLIVFRRRLVDLYRASRRPDHFDELAERYDEELPGWVRERLLGRKVDLMRRRLSELGAPAGRGLDLGCGQGWHLARMSAEGCRMAGVDRAAKQAVAAGQTSGAARRACPSGAPCGLAVADAGRLPFADASFDFAYAVNSFHHIADDAQRRAALGEVVRVLKPGGVFFLHEMNTANPLFRLYLGYVFPLIRGIDEGTERWVRADALPAVDGAKWQPGVDYFTFLPDFLPAGLLRRLESLERMLERSRCRRWSAHYMARLVKSG
ncbi:MAG: methyltransferase domain-containing protein [Deltaproteobacteria bacterium]|nr:methyltransferase domain-containing protein [Deltaproteobacteria bacterium]